MPSALSIDTVFVPIIVPPVNLVQFFCSNESTNHASLVPSPHTLGNKVITIHVNNLKYRQASRELFYCGTISGTNTVASYSSLASSPGSPCVAALK